jgi:hypothetical protein
LASFKATSVVKRRPEGAEEELEEDEVETEEEEEED